MPLNVVFRVRGAAAHGVVAALLILANAVPVAAAERPFVSLHTDAGTISAVLYPELAPHHVANFLHLSRTGFYNGTLFHRIVPGYIIQGGDPNSKDEDPRNDGLGGPSLEDVLGPEELALVEEVNTLLAEKGYTGVNEEVNLKAEFSTDVTHERGVLSMARAPDPDSAGSQFFIAVTATPQLDGQYTIFGQVVEGMDVVDAIVSAPTDPAIRQRPAEPVSIVSMEVFASVQELPAALREAYERLEAP
jgi:peptidyl-prolyl cis-trans isomerase B (cyclophilin B)